MEIQLLLLNLCKTYFLLCDIVELTSCMNLLSLGDVKLMNAYDTTCFSHFLDLLTYIQKPPSLMIATFFCKKNQKNVVWIELRCWSKKEIFKIEFKNLKLFLKSSQEQHTRVQMKKSRHAVLSPNFSCVALMSLYNNHCFIRSTKNEEEKTF